MRRFWDWVLSFFRTEPEPPAPADVRVTLPNHPPPLDYPKPPLKHVRTFVCDCNATMRIRSRDARDDGPSNFVAFPPAHPRKGHAQQPSGVLNWAGLAEERGWKTDPVQCPACQRGMTVADYKKAKKLGRLK
jgi:hypothetical protein